MKKILMFAGIGLIAILSVVVVLVLFVFNDSEDKPAKKKTELLYEYEEQVVDVPVGDEEESRKILKFQLTIAYTDPKFEELLQNRHAEVIDFVNGYFRDVTTETLNRKNGKERVKEEILENLIEMFETDSDNFTKVYFPQFIIP